MSHSDCVVFVVVVERWKSQVGGGWIVGFIFVLFVCFVFCVCICVCVCVCMCVWWLPVEKWRKRKAVGA